MYVSVLVHFQSPVMRIGLWLAHSRLSASSAAWWFQVSNRKNKTGMDPLRIRANHTDLCGLRSSRRVAVAQSKKVIGGLGNFPKMYILSLLSFLPEKYLVRLGNEKGSIYLHRAEKTQRGRFGWSMSTSHNSQPHWICKICFDFRFSWVWIIGPSLTCLLHRRTPRVMAGTER